MTETTPNSVGDHSDPVAELQAAYGDQCTLEEIGFGLSQSGHDLPAALLALPPSDQSPAQNAAIVRGYLRGLAELNRDSTTDVRLELNRRRAELKALQRVNAVATSMLDETTVLNKV